MGYGPKFLVNQVSKTKILCYSGIILGDVVYERVDCIYCLLFKEGIKDLIINNLGYFNIYLIILQGSIYLVPQPSHGTVIPSSNVLDSSRNWHSDRRYFKSREFRLRMH